MRRGLERAVDDAERADAIGGFRATALRFAAENVPVEQLANLVETVQSLPGALISSWERARGRRTRPGCS